MEKKKVSIQIGKKWYKFEEPFECICCRKIIRLEQFCFSMLCGYCDTGRCGRIEEGHGHTIKELIRDKGEPDTRLNMLEKLK